uniref:Uncharacterized protein n=1 Tax=Hyaloperonospora arabidopsidis (strain Emoy2) TaxID=559515 RepID=M4BAY5_HYAAE
MFKASEKVGESVKLEFWKQGRSEIMLAISGKEGGKTLPLITWEQFPDKARCSLNEAKWINGEERMPLSDARFKEILTDDWPFDE